MLGFEGYTNITEGRRIATYYPKGSDETKPLGFEAALNKFTISHDADHNPTVYNSDLSIYENGKLAAHKIIDVNHPLSYKGKSFYQVDYGLEGFMLKVTGPNGETIRVPFTVNTEASPGGKMYVISDDLWKQILVGGKKLTVFVHNFVPDYIGGKKINASSMPINPAADVMINERFPEYRGLDAWHKLGWLMVGKSADYKGITITMEKTTKYTTLQVSENPGLPVIYLGFALMIIGVFVSFYVSHKTIRGSIMPSDGGAIIVAGATSRSEPETFDKDFQQLREVNI
jgi:cytochrome c biogenesis protein